MSQTAKAKGKINIILWQSHKLKRKIRNTLAAETMAANEGVEAGDLIRAYLAVLMNPGPYPKREWESYVRTIPHEMITDPKSLFDHLNKPGSTPGDKRLRLDMEILREQLETMALTVRWVSSEQMPADALIKGSVQTMAYMRRVWSTNLVYLAFGPRV